MNVSSMKKLVFFGVIALVVSSVLAVFISTINYNSYNKEKNKTILTVVSAVLENENIDEIVIAKILKNPQNVDLSVLKKYGYDLETDYFLKEFEYNFLWNTVKNIVIIDLFVLVLIAFLALHIYKREKNVDKLSDYLERLNNKDYNLEIEENTESELSKLQNEIYRITILLREQAETSLKDKLLLKDNIANISHQLKTPLTSMSIMLDNILEYPNMQEDTKYKFLQNVNQKLLHMETLVKNLLKLSRLDANDIILKNEKINTKEFLLQIIKNLQEIIDEKNIKINLSGSEKSYFIGDNLWQSEAISNILKNSIEHSKEIGEIDIFYSSNNFSSKIVIKDYGQGIKKENLKKIFERFYKDETSNENSLGIGLNLAKTIISQNGGTVFASSIEGEFAQFEIMYQSRE